MKFYLLQGEFFSSSSDEDFIPPSGVAADEVFHGPFIPTTIGDWLQVVGFAVAPNGTLNVLSRGMKSPYKLQELNRLRGDLERLREYFRSQMEDPDANQRVVDQLQSERIRLRGLVEAVEEEI